MGRALAPQHLARRGPAAGESERGELLAAKVRVDRGEVGGEHGIGLECRGAAVGGEVVDVTPGANGVPVRVARISSGRPSQATSLACTARSGSSADRSSVSAERASRRNALAGARRAGVHSGGSACGVKSSPPRPMTTVASPSASASYTGTR